MASPVKPLAALVAFLALAGAAPAQAPIDPGDAILLRCSAAFAIVAGDQARGLPAAKAYPPLAERGKEFFVRASTQLMDELHLTREQVQALLQQQVAQLQQGSAAAKDRAAYLDQVMQPCLEELDGAGL
jgi:hypothetical protein